MYEYVSLHVSVHKCGFEGVFPLGRGRTTRNSKRYTMRATLKIEPSMYAFYTSSERTHDDAPLNESHAYIHTISRRDTMFLAFFLCTTFYPRAEELSKQRKRIVPHSGGFYI